MSGASFINLGEMEINVSLITRVQWDFAGHGNTAMITFVGGDFCWIQERVWTGELREALRLLGKVAED